VTTVGAGQTVTAAHMNEALAGITPVVTTTTATIGTVASGYTVNDVRAATLCGGKLIDIDIYVNNTAAITATTGNINPDITIFTLNSAYWPTHTIPAVFGNGAVTGEAVINTDGTINLRSASDSLGAGTNIRVHATYIHT